MSSKDHVLRQYRRRRSRPAGGSTGASPVPRIDALTATGRANWLALLAFLSFSLVTTLGVEDVDFFVDERQTQLPLIGVSIPTFSFFVFAPILGAALYVYLHLHLSKVTEALAEAPAGAPPLEESIKPWLLNDYVLRHRSEPAIRARPLDWMANLATLLLIWFAGPLVLVLMWWRTWPAHSVALTSVSGVAIVLTVFVGLRSWKKLREDMRRPTWFVPVLGVTTCVAVVVLGRGYTSTSGWVPPIVNPSLPMEILRYGLVARAEMRGAVLSELPLEAQDHVSSHLAFRQQWCALRDVPQDVCKRLSTPTAQASRFDSIAFRNCSEQRDFATCFRVAAPQDDALIKAWHAHRRTRIDALKRPELSRRDLSAARLRYAKLVGVDAVSADFRSSEFVSAQLEQSDFRKSDLSNAQFHHANLRGAYFFWAELERARFSFADLQLADFNGATGRSVGFNSARLEGARLGEVLFPGANFTNAGLGHAYLFGADFTDGHFSGADLAFAYAPRTNIQRAAFQRSKLTGANFAYANFDEAFLLETEFVGTHLLGASFKGARFDGTVMQAVLAPRADFRGAVSLDQSHLIGVVGDEKTLLPDIVDPQTGEHLYVLSCLPAGSQGWEHLTYDIWRIARGDAEAAAERLGEILCDAGERPRKTGLPWKQDMPPPWENDANWTPPDRGFVEAPTQQ